ncbi:MAG: cell division protein SepF, partial [Specibacter sp.]
MAGALRKTMIYLGLADGDEHFDAEQAPVVPKNEAFLVDLEREAAPAPA